ncbi:MAG: hypothetical protein QM811_01660 [Pirellulales bacterium]
MGDDLRNADLVMLNDVLEHVRDDFLLLSRVMAELRPGAICLLTVPADMALWSPHDVAFGHYRRYDRAGSRACGAVCRSAYGWSRTSTHGCIRSFAACGR